MTYKEYVIPKKNGKVRKIVAPDDELKAFQRSHLRTLRQIFSNVCAEQWLPGNIFHGFLRGKNCVTAAKQHIGYKTSVMMDISHFFDKVQINHVAKHKLDMRLFHKDGHAAQGFPSSPMIANIAVVAVMGYISNTCNHTFGTQNYALTIYADDVCISHNGSAQDSQHAIEEVTKHFNKAGFAINTSKTRIKHAKHGYRRILGINVGNDHIRATRKVMRKLRAATHQNNGPSMGGLTTWSQCIEPRVRRGR